jgi:hypothetical protein
MIGHWLEPNTTCKNLGSKVSQLSAKKCDLVPATGNGVTMKCGLNHQSDSRSTGNDLDLPRTFAETVAEDVTKQTRRKRTRRLRSKRRNRKRTKDKELFQRGNNGEKEAKLSQAIVQRSLANAEEEAESDRGNAQRSLEDPEEEAQLDEANVQSSLTDAANETEVDKAVAQPSLETAAKEAQAAHAFVQCSLADAKTSLYQIAVLPSEPAADNKAGQTGQTQTNRSFLIGNSTTDGPLILTSTEVGSTKAPIPQGTTRLCLSDNITSRKNQSLERDSNGQSPVVIEPAKVSSCEKIASDQELSSHDSHQNTNDHCGEIAPTSIPDNIATTHVNITTTRLSEGVTVADDNSSDHLLRQPSSLSKVDSPGKYSKLENSHSLQVAMNNNILAETVSSNEHNGQLGFNVDDETRRTSNGERKVFKKGSCAAGTAKSAEKRTSLIDDKDDAESSQGSLREQIDHHESVELNSCDKNSDAASEVRVMSTATNGVSSTSKITPGRLVEHWRPLKSIESYPELPNPENLVSKDKIAYKILELADNCVPEITDYKIAEVVENKSTDQILVLRLFNEKLGKAKVGRLFMDEKVEFGLENGNNENQDNVAAVPYAELRDARLLTSTSP